MAQILASRYIGPVSYTPAPVKTQPIVYPANPIAPTTQATGGSPSLADENLDTVPTGIHAVLSTVVHPVMSVSGISENPVPFGAAAPIVGTSEGSAVPLSIGGVAAPLPSIVGIAPGLATVAAPASTGSENYIFIAAVIALLYFMLRREGV